MAWFLLCTMAGLPPLDGLFPMSPNTRRRQRGRGVVVLDNLTGAPTITNATVMHRKTFVIIASQLSGPY